MDIGTPKCGVFVSRFQIMPSIGLGQATAYSQLCPWFLNAMRCELRGNIQVTQPRQLPSYEEESLYTQSKKNHSLHANSSKATLHIHAHVLVVSTC